MLLLRIRSTQGHLPILPPLCHSSEGKRRNGSSIDSDMQIVPLGRPGSQKRVKTTSIYFSNGEIKLKDIELIDLSDNAKQMLSEGYANFDGYNRCRMPQSIIENMIKTRTIGELVGYEMASIDFTLAPFGIIYHEMVLEPDPANRWYTNHFKEYFINFYQDVSNKIDEGMFPLVTVSLEDIGSNDPDGYWKMAAFFEQMNLFAMQGDISSKKWFVTEIKREGRDVWKQIVIRANFETLFGAIPLPARDVVMSRYADALDLKARERFDLAMACYGSVLEYILYLKAVSIDPDYTSDRINDLIVFFSNNRHHRNPLCPDQYSLSIQEEDRLKLVMDDRNAIHINNRLDRDEGDLKMDFENLESIFRTLCMKYLT